MPVRACSACPNSWAITTSAAHLSCATIGTARRQQVAVVDLLVGRAVEGVDPASPHLVVISRAVDRHRRPHDDELGGRQRRLPDPDQALHQAVEVLLELRVAGVPTLIGRAVAAHRDRAPTGRRTGCRSASCSASLVGVGRRQRRRVQVRRRHLVVVVLVRGVGRAAATRLASTRPARAEHDQPDHAEQHRRQRIAASAAAAAAAPAVVGHGACGPPNDGRPAAAASRTARRGWPAR